MGEVDGGKAALGSPHTQCCQRRCLWPRTCSVALVDPALPLLCNRRENFGRLQRVWLYEFAVLYKVRVDPVAPLRTCRVFFSRPCCSTVVAAPTGLPSLTPVHIDCAFTDCEWHAGSVPQLRRVCPVARVNV